MTFDQENPSDKPAPDSAPAANTGNASNPPAHTEETGAPASQLLDKQAEKYLREAGNIEDVPDAQDQQEMDETIKENSGS